MSETSERRQAYAAGWARERRQENTAALQRIKVDLGCVDCGYRAHPAALDFDHRDPSTKSFVISRNSTAEHLTAALIDAGFGS